MLTADMKVELFQKIILRLISKVIENGFFDQS